MMEEVSLSTFIDTLEGLVAAGFETGDVHRLLLATVIQPADLGRYLTFRPDRYTRNLIHKSETFELLVIGWDIGQKAPVHGHEGERCWARVERGRLRFTNYEEVSAEPLRLRPIGEPVDGGRGHLDGPADIHEVANPASFGERAASLHLYSHPFPECDIYDLTAGKKKRVQLAYDTLYGQPATPVS
jgi:predicted metal-dependent enzyme (double-stranded beta helix superfamily)